MAETGKPTFQCTVIAPKGKRLACRAVSVEVPAHDGQLGVLSHHAPFFCQLTFGLMKVTELPLSSDAAAPEVHHQIIIDRGFMLVADNSLTVIAYDVITEEDMKEDSFADRLDQLNRRLQDETRTGDQRHHDEKEKALIERLMAT